MDDRFDKWLAEVLAITWKKKAGALSAGDIQRFATRKGLSADERQAFESWIWREKLPRRPRSLRRRRRQGERRRPSA